MTAHRQVLSVPRLARSRWIPVTIGFAAIVTAGLAVLLVSNGDEPGPLSPPADAPAASPIIAAPNLASPPVVGSAIAGQTSSQLFPQQSSRLMSPSGDVTIDVPVGAVSQAVTLWYQSVAPESVPPLPTGISGATTVFDLQVTGASQLNEGTYRFETSVKVTVELTDENVRTAGNDSSILVLQHYTRANTSWEELKTEVDLRGRTASAEVHSVSIFALTVRAISTPTATPVATAAAKPTPTNTSAPLPTVTPTYTPQPTLTPPVLKTPVNGRIYNNLDPNVAPSPTVTPSPTLTATATPAPTPTPSATPSPTTTPPPTATHTPTPTPILPNLKPFQPEHWEAPLVVSENRTHFLAVPPPSAFEFTVDKDLYVHWAITNESSEPVSRMFQVGIKVDGTLRVTFPVSMLEPGEILRMLNAGLSPESPGQHLMELIVDVDNRIDESDETDNTFTITPVWVTPTPVPSTPAQSIQVYPTPTPSASAVMSPIVEFALENLSVSVGATIRWENQDAAPHTSTSGVSPNQDGIWDSGILNTGQNFGFTFQNPGVFPYYCTVHPFMTATITVTQ